MLPANESKTQHIHGNTIISIYNYNSYEVIEDSVMSFPSVCIFISAFIGVGVKLPVHTLPSWGLKMPSGEEFPLNTGKKNILAQDQSRSM